VVSRWQFRQRITGSHRFSNLVATTTPLNNTKEASPIHKELLQYIVSIARDSSLRLENNFVPRAQAIDDIEFYVIDRIEVMEETEGATGSLSSLKQYAINVKHELEEIDRNLFHRLRTEISAGADHSRQLLHWLSTYLGDKVLNAPPGAEGYDLLDVFINGLLSPHEIPAETIIRESEMVFYQKTPARIILELVKRAEFKLTDVFFDIGAGLGQPVLLVNLLAGVTAKGIEFERAFCSYASACATTLHLQQVHFINADAREADYSSGTIFFLYTPFSGNMLQKVMTRLHNEAKKRSVKIFTYGPCTPAVAQQPWLIEVTDGQHHPDHLAEFISR